MDRLLHSRIFFKGLTSVLFILFIGISWRGYAQPRLSASASEKEISKNDYVEVQFSVENAVNVEHINPPVFRNFDVVSGPSQQSGMSNINGNVKRYIALSYVLKPRSTGKFTIPGATAKADGKDLRSNPVTITVTNASSSNKSGGNSFTSPFANLALDMPSEPPIHEYDDYILHKGDNIEEKIKKNLFIKVEASKTSCYVGEPIVATYKLYTRLKSESNIIKSPSLNGFSVSELGTSPDYSLSTQKFNGRDYSVYILRKVQLYPLQPGTVELDPAEIENKITFIKAEYAAARKGDVFYDMLRNFADASTPPEAIQQKAVTLKSEPLNIIVKPLPEENKPADFKGAVGNFKIEATLEKNRITTDDAGMLRIIIAGEGNLQMINAPKLNWPQGLEGFDPKSSENISKMNVPMKGEKVFSYPFTVSRPGSYIIPGPIFSYFDPAGKSYQTITTTNINLTVTQGTGIKPAIAGSSAYNDSARQDFGDKLYENRWLLLGVLGITIFLIIWFVRNGNQQKVVIENVEDVNEQTMNKIEPETVVPQNPFAAAEEKLLQHDNRGFFHDLQQSLRTYLSRKLDVPEEELTRKRINERLDKFNVGIGTTLKLSSLMDEIDMNLYAPLSSANEMETIYEKANEVVALLDKQIS